MDENSAENRREFVRLRLTIPIFAELSLSRIGEREMRSRTRRVNMEDIGPGGCRFTTWLRLPSREDVEWLLKFRLGKHFIHLKAQVLWSDADDEGMFTHGAKWRMTEFERQVYRYRLYEFMRTMLVASPHIHMLYKKMAARSQEEPVRRLDLGC